MKLRNGKEYNFQITTPKPTPKQTPKQTPKPKHTPKPTPKPRTKKTNKKISVFDWDEFRKLPDFGGMGMGLWTPWP